MGTYCKSCYSSSIDTFKNIQRVAIISYKFPFITQINVIYVSRVHSDQGKSGNYQGIY